MSHNKYIKVPIKGMHCRSCEILIEESLEQMKGVQKAEVNLAENRLEIDSSEKIKAEKLNNIFKKNGYKFFELRNKPFVPQERDISLDRATSKWWWVPALGIVMVFLILNKLGLGTLLNINSQSSLLTFLFLELLLDFQLVGLC